MHETISRGLEKDLSVLKEAFNNNVLFKEIIGILAKTHTKLPKDEFLIYPNAYKAIEELLPQTTKITYETSEAMSDINKWLIGTNVGYNNIDSRLLGENTKIEIYDYLIKVASQE